jgi:flagellar basal body-associated protein FliL
MDCDDDGSTTDTASALEQGPINDEKAPQLAAKENLWVSISRLLVIVVLSITTFVTCLLLFLFMSEQEESNFESDVSILAVMLLLSTSQTDSEDTCFVVNSSSSNAM